MKSATILNNIESIIFDLDGTIWNPMNVVLKAWEEAVEHSPYLDTPVTEKELQSVFGMQHDLIGAALFPSLTPQQQNEVMETCYANENSMISRIGGDLFEHVESVLQELSRHYHLYIVSNCQSGYIEAFYEYHKLDHFFKDQECSGNTGKPKSENIKEIIRRNNIQNTVYIGDTQGDKDACAQAGVPFIFADYGFGSVSEADYRISAFSQLPDLLKVPGTV